MTATPSPAESPGPALRRLPRPPFLALFFAGYVLAAGFAKALALIPDTGISIWPPSGLFVATLIFCRDRTWPWWILTGLAAELVANLVWFQNPLPVAVLINAGNALEAVTAAWLVTRVCPRPVKLDTLREVVALLALGAGVAPVVGATIGSATLAVFGIQGFAESWLLWWIGDATGVLIVAPLVLVLLADWQGRLALTGARLAEAGLLGLVFVGVSALSLSGYLPFAYIIMPALLWAAVRFEVKGAAVTLVLLAVLTGVFTLTGMSQFAGEPDAQKHNQVMLQLFLVISALCALVVAALSRQHQKALLTLQRANDELESRVAERTANLQESERRLAAVLNALPMGVALHDEGGRVLLGNEVYRAYVPDVAPSRDEVRHKLWVAYEPNGNRLERRNFPVARALRGERVIPGVDFLYFGDEARGPLWTRVTALPFHDEHGRTVGVTTVIDDIDQEKRAVDALRASEAQMRLVQEGTGVGTWAWDIAAGTVTWSEQNYRLHGLDPAMGPPSYDDWRGAIHPEDRDRTNAAVLEAVARRDGFDTEYRVQLPDGGVRWLVGRGGITTDPTGRPDRMMGINIDITARKEIEEQQLLLAREVDHRAKNALAVVQSLVRLTRATDAKSFAQALEGRISALARAHTLLARERWAGGNLAALLEEELGAYVPTGQVVLAGPSVTLKADAVQPLSMCVHELATNAAKYGALSIPGGRVDVQWRLEKGLILSWREAGGPRVAEPPLQAGFGSKLLDATVRGQLGGEIRSEWRQSGLSCELHIAADRLQPGPALMRRRSPEPAAVLTPSAPRPRPGLRVLLAEDEALVAMSLESELRALGCEVIGVASTLEGLQAHVQSGAPLDLALLDVNLAGQPSFPIADALVARRVPIIFATGYGDLPDRRWTANGQTVLLRKPVATADLAQAIAALCPGDGDSTKGTLARPLAS